MVIGITGGVGCGKSTVLGILKESFNGYIIDADKVAHRLMEPFNPAYDSIRAEFGDEIIGDDGFIDRKKLGQIVFNDSKKLKRLNAIVHPMVKEAIKSEISKVNKCGSGADAKCPKEGRLIAVEAALLIEAGYMDICDELWYIYTDNETRIKRLIKSRGYTRKKAESIIANQLSDREFRNNCHIVIDNGGSEADTRISIADALNKQSRK